LKQTLLDLGIAEPHELSGLSEEEIGALERRYGIFPDSYRQILAAIGHDAGALFDPTEFWLLGTQLDRINALGQQAVRTWREDGMSHTVPDDVFFIACRYQQMFNFLRLGGATDSPVWLFDDDQGRIVETSESVWGWIEAFVEDARRYKAFYRARRSMT
jgi:hypothetical protein